jgi:transcriptional regulator with XRE-family HTH domain
MAEIANDAAEDGAAETMRRVGAQVRRLRTKRGMTLQQMSAETGTSVSMLSMLERGVATPSIGTLVTVASVLGTHMAELFGEQQEPRSPLRPQSEQVEVNSGEGVVRRAVHTDARRGLEMVVNEYAPGTSSGRDPSHHPGTEFGVLVSGSLVVEVDGVEYTLKPGDGMTYSSQIPHRFENRSRSVARAVWVNLDE